jgi:hypothetical protein
MQYHINNNKISQKYHSTTVTQETIVRSNQKSIAIAIAIAGTTRMAEDRVESRGQPLLLLLLHPYYPYYYYTTAIATQDMELSAFSMVSCKERKSLIGSRQAAFSSACTTMRTFCWCIHLLA